MQAGAGFASVGSLPSLLQPGQQTSTQRQGRRQQAVARQGDHKKNRCAAPVDRADASGGSGVRRRDRMTNGSAGAPRPRAAARLRAGVMGRRKVGATRGALAVPVIAADARGCCRVTARSAGAQRRPGAVGLQKWSKGASGARDAATTGTGCGQGPWAAARRRAAPERSSAAPRRRGGWKGRGAAPRRPSGASRGVGETGRRGAPRRRGQHRRTGEAVTSATAARLTAEAQVRYAGQRGRCGGHGRQWGSATAGGSGALRRPATARQRAAAARQRPWAATAISGAVAGGGGLWRQPRCMMQASGGAAHASRAGAG